MGGSLRACRTIVRGFTSGSRSPWLHSPTIQSLFTDSHAFPHLRDEPSRWRRRAPLQPPPPPPPLPSRASRHYALPYTASACARHHRPRLPPFPWGRAVVLCPVSAVEPPRGRSRPPPSLLLRLVFVFISPSVSATFDLQLAVNSFAVIAHNLLTDLAFQPGAGAGHTCFDVGPWDINVECATHV